MTPPYCATEIASLQGILSLKRGSRVVVSVPSIPSGESTKLQDQINLLLSDCGCSLGACALLLAVAACLAFDAWHWPKVATHPLRIFGIDLLACFVVAGIGKSIGLWRARKRLARLISNIERQLA